MNRNQTDNLRNTLLAQPAPRPASSTMYLLRLRSHLSRGKIALGQVIDAVSEVLPRSRSRSRSSRR